MTPSPSFLQFLITVQYASACKDAAVLKKETILPAEKPHPPRVQNQFTFGPTMAACSKLPFGNWRERPGRAAEPFQ